MTDQTYRHISKAIHIGIYSDKDINTAIAAYRKAGGSQGKTVSLWMKKIFHRHIKRSLTPASDESLFSVNTFLSSASVYDKSDILLISHEMSLTGAPVALMFLACTLKSIGYRPTILTFADGPLSEDARRDGIPVLVANPEFIAPYIPIAQSHDEGESIRALINMYPTVIYNTIISVDILSRFISPENSYAWIHEAAYGYKDLRNDKDKITDSLKRAKKVLIVGEYARNIFDSFTDGEIPTQNLLYGIPYFTPGHSSPSIKVPGKLNIIMSGLMSRRKGTDILLEAVNLLTEDEQNHMVIHLVGGCFDSHIRRKIRRAPACVKWWGLQPHERLIDIFSDMDVTVCPSIDDPMPIVCTESFQQGVPVVVSESTGTAPLIKEGIDGFTFSANSVELAEKLRYLIRISPEKLKEIGQKGKIIYKENFSEEVFTKNVTRFFPPRDNG